MHFLACPGRPVPAVSPPGLAPPTARAGPAGAAGSRCAVRRYGARGGVVEAIRRRSGRIPSLWALSSHASAVMATLGAWGPMAVGFDPQAEADSWRRMAAFFH